MSALERMPDQLVAPGLPAVVVVVDVDRQRVVAGALHEAGHLVDGRGDGACQRLGVVVVVRVEHVDDDQRGLGHGAAV